AADANDGTRFVGWTQPGEWMRYTVNFDATATYDFSARVASLGRGGAFHVEVDGVNVTGPINVPNTREWERFTTVTRRGVKVGAGLHVVTIVIDKGSAVNGYAGNVDAFAFTPRAS